MSQAKKNFPEALYDILCGKMKEDLHIYSFERLNTEYTPTTIGPNACTTSTIGPTTLHPYFGRMACVCRCFSAELKRFRANKVELVEALITSDLLDQCKHVISTAFTMTSQIGVQWELMFHEQKIYRIRAYRRSGWLTVHFTSQKDDAQSCRSLRLKEEANEAMTMVAFASKKDVIVNLVMQDLETWPTLTPLGDQGDYTVLVTFLTLGD